MAGFVPSGAGGLVASSTIVGASAPTIENLELTSANTEYTYAVPSNTKQLRLGPRVGGGLLKLAFLTGQSGVEYVSIHPGATLPIPDLTVTGLTLYIQSPKAGTIVELMSWA